VEPRYAEMNAPPGLKVQHVTGDKGRRSNIRGRSRGIRGRLQEAQVQAEDKGGGAFTFNVGTAGSISLVLQALMPAVNAAQYSNMVTVH